MKTPLQVTPIEDSKGNLRAWALCAPACAVMFAFNLWPAGQALLDGPPLPLADELASWAIATLRIGAGALAVSILILLIEVPLAIYLALSLHRRSAMVPPTGMLLAGVVVGFSWRLLFGGALGFLAGESPALVTAAIEVWRSLPLTTLLFYYVLLRAGLEHAQIARLEMPETRRLFRRVLLPSCEPAIFLLAGLRFADYLRAVPTSFDPTGATERAVWFLLVLTVAALALAVARAGRETA